MLTAAVLFYSTKNDVYMSFDLSVSDQNQLVRRDFVTRIWHAYIIYTHIYPVNYYFRDGTLLLIVSIPHCHHVVPMDSRIDTLDANAAIADARTFETTNSQRGTQQLAVHVMYLDLIPRDFLAFIYITHQANKSFDDCATTHAPR